MKISRKLHHAGRILSLLLVFCMTMAFLPLTAFAGVTDVTSGATSNVYNHTYHTKVKMTANVTVKDSDGNIADTKQIAEEGDFIVGNVSDNAVQSEITRIKNVIYSQLPDGTVTESIDRTTLVFDHFESSYIVNQSCDAILVGDIEDLEDAYQQQGNTTKTLDVHEYQVYEITYDLTVLQTGSKGSEKTDSSADKSTTSPQTGDNSHLTLWFVVLLVLCGGLIACTVYGRRKCFNRR